MPDMKPNLKKKHTYVFLLSHKHFSAYYKCYFQCFVHQSTEDDRRICQNMSFKLTSLVIYVYFYYNQASKFIEAIKQQFVNGTSLTKRLKVAADKLKGKGMLFGCKWPFEERSLA